MRKTRKPLAIGIALALVAALGVGATLAWLTDEDSVTNTFTVGNVGISLDEADVNEYGEFLYKQGNDLVTEGDLEDETNAELADRVIANEYKMIPGMTYVKDPVVHVDAGSESCWLFVKADELYNTLGEGKFIQWGIDADVWTELEGGVWYAEHDGSVRDYNVIQDGEITVNEAATKSHMDAFADGSAQKPQLTFTAYAVQMAGFETAADAWAATFGAPQGA